MDLSGGVAATSAADGTVRLWDAAGAFATQRPLAAPRGAGEDEEQGAWDVPPGVEGEAPSEQHAALATSGDAGRRDEARDAFEIACVRASPGEVEVWYSQAPQPPSPAVSSFFLLLRPCLGVIIPEVCGTFFLFAGCLLPFARRGCGARGCEHARRARRDL